MTSIQDYQGLEHAVEFLTPRLACANHLPFVWTGRETEPSPAGVSLLCPSRPCAGFADAITTEMSLKREFLAAGQTIESLLLRGDPMRQFNAEQLTELVFRFCTGFDLADTDLGCRSIALTPEYCTRTNLALVKGLAFNFVELHLDASIAGPDRSIAPMERAATLIGEFAGLGLHCRIRLSADTDGGFIERLTTTLMACDCREIEFIPSPPPLRRGGNYRIGRPVRQRIARLLQEAGYRLRGDRDFTNETGPGNGLRYGEWGFYDGRIQTWLGLGPAATGIVRRHLYRNARDIDAYLAKVKEGTQPVAEWSEAPVLSEPACEAAQQLFCYHRLPGNTDPETMANLEKPMARGWLRTEGDSYSLTDAGIDNLRTLCRDLAHRRHPLD